MNATGETRGGGSRLSRISGLFGLSCWLDWQTNQTDQTDQRDQRDAQGGYTFGMRSVLLIIKVPDRTNSKDRGCRSQGPRVHVPQ